MKNLLTLLMIGLMALTAQAQKGTISGKVTDQQGNPLIGANVLVKNTTIGTSTDVNGAYSLAVDAGSYTVLVTLLVLPMQNRKSRLLKTDVRRLISACRKVQPLMKW